VRLEIRDGDRLRGLVQEPMRSTSDPSGSSRGNRPARISLNRWTSDVCTESDLVLIELDQRPRSEPCSTITVTSTFHDKNVVSGFSRTVTRSPEGGDYI